MDLQRQRQVVVKMVMIANQKTGRAYTLPELEALAEFGNATT